LIRFTIGAGPSVAFVAYTMSWLVLTTLNTWSAVTGPLRCGSGVITGVGRGVGEEGAAAVGPQAATISTSKRPTMEMAGAN
jgi:hypothetical protein